MDLRAVRKNVIETEQEQAEQQEPAVFTKSESQVQAADPAPRKQQHCRQDIAVKDRYFRFDHAELELDREERRAPDQHGDGV